MGKRKRRNEMKILHIAVNGLYTDGMSYHENLLPLFHKLNDNDVEILASQYCFDGDGQDAIAGKSDYVDCNGIRVKRLKIEGDKSVHAKFKRFVDFYASIEEFQPDVVFCHLFQFLDAKSLVRYKKDHPSVKIYFDSHADYSNSARNWVSKHILHGIVWRSLAKKILPVANAFYGVLPARVSFLKERYKLNSAKIKLLPMGADDRYVEKASLPGSRMEIRRKYGVKESDFLIVFGGKIDASKRQVIYLMRAIQKLASKHVQLIVFGSVDKEFEEDFKKASSSPNIHYIGWLQSKDTYPVFAASDLACFPGRHSVFWEQLVAQGVPLLVKKWDGIDHIDFNGNVAYLYESSESEILDKITAIIEKDYPQMLAVAKSDRRKQFLYSYLAKKSIEE